MSDVPRIDTLRRLDGVRIVYRPLDVSLEAIQEALNEANLGDYIPETRTDYDALNRACQQYAQERLAAKDTRFTTQARKRKKKNGLEVVRVELGEDGNDYAKAFNAKVDEGYVLCRNGADEQWLNVAYQIGKQECPAGHVRLKLEAFLGSLGGIKIIPGLFWVPEEGRQAFQAAQAAWGVAVQMYVSEHDLSEGDNCKLVADAVTADIQRKLAQIEKDITENQLGVEALQRRQQEALHLRERIDFYSRVLGDTTRAMQAIVDMVDRAAAAAIAIQLSSEMGFPGGGNG
jgi:hypothetical protein